MQPKKREIKISKRDKEIIELVSLGYSNNEIAENMNLSLASIQASIVNILRKTNTANRTHLVRWGFENNYLT